MQCLKNNGAFIFSHGLLPLCIFQWPFQVSGVGISHGCEKIAVNEKMGFAKRALHCFKFHGKPAKRASSYLWIGAYPVFCQGKAFHLFNHFRLIGSKLGSISQRGFNCFHIHYYPGIPQPSLVIHGICLYKFGNKLLGPFEMMGFPSVWTIL